MYNIIKTISLLLTLLVIIILQGCYLSKEPNPPTILPNPTEYDLYIPNTPISTQQQNPSTPTLNWSVLSEQSCNSIGATNHITNVIPGYCTSNDLNNLLLSINPINSSIPLEPIFPSNNPTNQYALFQFFCTEQSLEHPEEPTTPTFSDNTTIITVVYHINSKQVTSINHSPITELYRNVNEEGGSIYLYQNSIVENRFPICGFSTSIPEL